jgi:hypothetical protein
MRCWDDRDAVAFHAELGASAAVLAAGFNLDCFLSRCGPRQVSELQLAPSPVCFGPLTLQLSWPSQACLCLT